MTDVPERQLQAETFLERGYTLELGTETDDQGTVWTTVKAVGKGYRFNSRSKHGLADALADMAKHLPLVDPDWRDEEA